MDFLETYNSDVTEDKQNISWLINSNLKPLFYRDLLKFIREDTLKLGVENEGKFCNKSIMQQLLTAKSALNAFDVKTIANARSRANPFEEIASAFFMNRAALKMANIDAITDFMFTDLDQQDKNSPVYFADVCGGPGGFSEYVLWRGKWFFKGFGITLKNEIDFGLNESKCASPATFHPFYGIEGDGNVCNPANIVDFRRKVLHETGGVHFVMADGGFCVDGNEELQEILSKDIYISQCLICLEILRTGGNFVLKLFDIFTSFSVGLIYLIHKCFEQICILKPNASRPANSERYLICKKFKNTEQTEEIRKYLRHIVNLSWIARENNGKIITEILSFDQIRLDETFLEYIFNSNNRLALRQIVSLEKLLVFCKDENKVELRQEVLREKCLNFWQIPKEFQLFTDLSIENILFETLKEQELLLIQPREINHIKNLEFTLSEVNEWHYCLMQSSREHNKSNFYIGTELSRVYKYVNKEWIRMKHMKLVCGTVLYGEIVKENGLNDDNDDIMKYSLHVIDALRLGDTSLVNMKFEERMRMISIYCHAVNHEHRHNFLRIRSKNVQKLSCLANHNVLNEKSIYRSVLPICGYKMKEEHFIINSILFFKSNQNQTFKSTHVLRAQLYLKQNAENNVCNFTLKFIKDFIQQQIKVL